jgi:hypothetical protein
MLPVGKRGKNTRITVVGARLDYYTAVEILMLILITK